MATREQSGTNIEPSLLQRVAAGVRYVVSGVGPESWFGPAQPLAPAAQDKTEGRGWDYPVAINTRIQPREGEAISFAALRGLADAYDLLRLVIETRKDQVGAYDWEVVPSDTNDSADNYKAEIKRVRDFLERPDKEHAWDQWLRMQLEDLLVIDAIAVYPRMNRGGGLYALELIDGATLKRVIDDSGRTPIPPDPAYQQVLKGIPAADYSRDDLIYTMRNPRTWKLYGYSPVEQVITTVNIALRRQLTQLAHYTEGNIPEALAQVPANWSMDQIKEFQLWWDSVMEGNLAQKRKMRFIPNLDNIVFPKDAVLKDEMDEWLARIVCFAFSISPSALIKQVNRASGQQMADTAKEEGLMPLLGFISTHMTYLVQHCLGAPDLKFRFKVVNKVAPKDQAEIHGIYVDKQVLTPDEVREDLDRDALTPAQREAAFPAPPAPPVPGDNPNAQAGAEDKVATGGAKESAAEKMLADAIRMLDPSKLSEALQKAAQSQAPRIVEVRPEVNVEVGDVNLHTPLAKAPVTPADGGLAKRAADDRHAETMAAIAAVAERPHVINVAPAAVTVEAAQHHVNVAAPEVHPTINVAAPNISVEPAQVTVHTPATQVDVHVPEPRDSVDLIDRNERGDITRVEHKFTP